MRRRITAVVSGVVLFTGGALLPIAATAHAAAPDCFGHRPTIVGTDKDDDMKGTAGRDVIVGLGGNDDISALDGDDLVCGGGGNDSIHGESERTA